MNLADMCSQKYRKKLGTVGGSRKNRRKEKVLIFEENRMRVNTKAYRWVLNTLKLCCFFF